MGNQFTELSWVDYERLIYAEVAYIQKRDKIATVIGSFIEVNDLPPRWPGTTRIADAIMKAFPHV